LITGASSGIGAAFARELASRGQSIIVVARREERLRSLSAKLEEEHAVHVEVLPADLAREESLARVERRIEESDDISMLINNAGFGTNGNFAQVDVTRSVDMITVHVTATIRLTRAVLPQMIARNCGAIVNVSSNIADVPGPGRAVYAATKAFLNSFSTSLQAEMQNQGLDIRVRAIVPGLTLTEFYSTEEFGCRGLGGEPLRYARPPERVANASLASLEKDEVIAFIDAENRDIYTLMVNEGKTWLEAARIVFDRADKPT
jgi:short-subunit dehydrogenase